MAPTTHSRNKSITVLLNGTIASLNNVLPMKHELSKPILQKDKIELSYAVLIGVTGDLKGKLVLLGEPSIFGSIGKVMFGMALEGEMLSSFSGELGNMVAGGIATNIVDHGLNIDITAPTILQGNTSLSGYKQAINLRVRLESGEELGLYLLLD
ncbi:chemotaxis protein CheX [Ornithinibacillus halophilus]|uniref:Chemotaxis protein CheX n=1 Tax=Ornithinibacillus halophilus TaxID=930117 RepID=A0A1M5FGK2_9BACI|nr:chemotaxis protein CheX [Ornithinibacillus halophilus]SHF90281.1 chemotaxis protein CheX [Ornithinibacillus halophilus]